MHSRPNADRIARFKREAQLLASLNHSHIGAIYGFEEDAGTYALVLELVEGPTLADRIAQGPLPLDEALPIAREIAEALEAAHEHRIIHRDLKPANIKLRPDGSVKVLDFGLAEAFDPGGAAESAGFAGTAAYMSPEQARGKSIDKRCDIWAFGCVLYEMLTGRRPFEGQDVTDVLARIVEQEPDFHALPAATPAPIRRLLQRCLEKDRRKRLPDIGVARIEIDDALTTPDEASPTRVRPAWIVAAALAGALIAGVVLYARSPPTASPPLVRASIPLEGQLDFAVQQLAFAVSPDGSRIVYRTVGGGPLRIRQLHDAQSTAIAGTEDASTPFFSPDGRWLGFFVGQTLKKVSVTGSAVVTIATLPRYVGAQGYRGAAWSDDGTIAFAPSTGAGLFGVSDRGGEAKPLTVIDPRANEAAHRWPHFLPGGKAILYTVKATHLQSFDDAQIVVRSLETGEQHAVAQGTFGAVSAHGAPGLRARGRFVRHAVRPRSARCHRRAGQGRRRSHHASRKRRRASRDLQERNAGLCGGRFQVRRATAAMGRSQRRCATRHRSASFVLVATHLSRRAASRRRHRRGVLEDLGPRRRARHAHAREPARRRSGSRRVDARRRARNVRRRYDRPRRGQLALAQVRRHRQRHAGVRGRQVAHAPGWSPDGRKLLYRQTGATTGQDVWLYSIDDRTATPFLQGPANETSASFSPDGRWVAYVSDESGAAQVYVRPVHGPGRSQVSVDGGTAPVWGRDGRELFFAKGDTLFAAPVTLGETFSSGAVRRLFSGPYTFDVLAVNYLQTVNYDVAPDGQRFLVPGNQAPAPHQLELVLNWFEDLNRLAPR